MERALRKKGVFCEASGIVLLIVNGGSTWDWCKKIQPTCGVAAIVGWTDDATEEQMRILVRRLDARLVIY